MQEMMFEIPSRSDVRKVVITPQAILRKEDPILVTLNELRTAS